MTQVELPTPAEVSAYRSKKLLAEAEKRFAAGRLWVYADVLAKYEEELLNGTVETETLPENNEHGGERIHSQNTAEDEKNHSKVLPVQQKLTRDQLILALMALSVRDFGPQNGETEPDVLTANFADSQQQEKKVKRRKESKKAHTFEGIGTKYRVEVGKRDGVKPGSIVGAITGESDIHSSQLGRIDIYPSFSIVEFEHELDEKTMRKISRAKVKGRALAISRDKGANAAKKGKRLKKELHHEQSALSATEYTESQIRKYRADKKYGDEKRSRLETLSRDERRMTKNARGKKQDKYLGKFAAKKHGGKKISGKKNRAK